MVYTQGGTREAMYLRVYTRRCTREAMYLRVYTQGVYQVGYTSLYASLCVPGGYTPPYMPPLPPWVYPRMYTTRTINIACTLVYVGVSRNEALGSKTEVSLG